MTGRICPSCRAPFLDGTLCQRCLDLLHDDLAAIPDAIAELHTQLARQSRAGNGDGGTARSATRPLPYDVAASEALSILRSVLVGWTKDVCEHHGRWPVDSMPAMARRLRWHEWVNHPAADQFADELHYALGQVTTCIDCPPQRRYLGPCMAPMTNEETGQPYQCHGDVVQRWNRMPRCTECDVTHAQGERLEWIMAIAQDQLVTATVAAGCLSAWGQHITPDLVRSWAHRGRILVKAHDPAGHPLYRFGDARQLAVDTLKRRTKEAAG